MKKLLSLLSVSMLLFVLAACGSESSEGSNGDSNTEKQETVQEEGVSKEVKTALLEYQGSVIKVIRSAESTFAGYATPEDVEAAEVKPATAAETVVSEIAGIEIPAELADYQADIEASSEKLSQFYTKKAELLEAGSEDLTEADALKQEYIDTINKVFNEVKLSVPTFDMVFQ